MPHRHQQSSRPAKPLPPPLLDQVALCLEEQLYPQAFSLLSSALTAGNSHEHNLSPAHIPPTQHLALAATLIVHPTLTTRTLSPEKHAAADLALSYLRHLNALVLPRQSGLNKALRFTASASGNFRASRRGRGQLQSATAEDDDNEDRPGHVRSPLVGEQSLWSCAEDFWAVVGWALNCSAVYPERWARWEVWLELVLDVLETDLASSIDKDSENQNGRDSTGEPAAECLLTIYLSPFMDQGRNNKRRLMRALLADGSPKSLAEFGEVWKNETKLPKRKDSEAERKNMKKRQKLDLEKEEYGDYLDSDSDNDSLSTNNRIRSRMSTPLCGDHPSQSTDDMEDDDDSDKDDQKPRLPAPSHSSFYIRRRFLALLSAYTTQNPTQFLPTDELYDLFTEFLRPLPLNTFQALLMPPKSLLPPLAERALVQTLLCGFLATPAPPCTPEDLNQDNWQVKYALSTATGTSATDNAKVALLVEALMRGLWRTRNLTAGQELSGFVDEGCKARLKKVGVQEGRRARGDRAKEEEEASNVMKCAGDRMKTMASLL